MSVAVVDHTAFVKIPGRANFTSSVDFRTLVTELRAHGVDRYVLDLGECVTMDSTFLGVLAGIALKQADAKDAKPSEKFQMELLNPNARIADLIDNLGVMDLFTVLHQANPCTAIFEPLKNNRPEPTREEMSRTCLEAHQLLMSINPENIPKFKDVTQFLAEDLRKMKEQQKPPEEPPTSGAQ
jgi:anti-sigma B factor antagonist